MVPSCFFFMLSSAFGCVGGSAFSSIHPGAEGKCFFFGHQSKASEGQLVIQTLVARAARSSRGTRETSLPTPPGSAASTMHVLPRRQAASGGGLTSDGRVSFLLGGLVWGDQRENPISVQDAFWVFVFWGILLVGFFEGEAEGEAKQFGVTPI